MDTATIARVLWLRRRLQQRERWTRPQVLAYQQRQLMSLRRFATAKSGFYRRVHRGLEDAPLAELPPLTKAQLMEQFDEISTDPACRLDDLQAYLDELHDNRRFQGRYWVSATSGSSGRRSVIPSNTSEWAAIIASYARANAWAGIAAGLGRRVSMAVVSSGTAWHQSSRVAATIRGPFIVSERLDAAAPLPRIVTRLNTLQPEVLIAYASMVRILAGEQLDGRLRISPRAVNSSSEVLSREARSMAIRAWDAEPFDVYAATETGGIAAECRHHHGLHLFEDLVVPEIVDRDYRPVAVGETGDRLLVTVLFSRTIPLVRYELTDQLQLATRPCSCSLPFQVASGVAGRTDDVLTLPGLADPHVRIHPVLFHQLLDGLDSAGWQVRQHSDALEVLVAAPSRPFDSHPVLLTLQDGLRNAGAAPVPVRIKVVEIIPTGVNGKRPLVVAFRPGTTTPMH